MAPKEITITGDRLRMLETLAGFGLTRPMIAAVLGMCARTLARRLKESPRVRDAFDAGRARAELTVARALFEKAISGGPDSMAAIRWIEMTRFGYSERMSIADRTALENPPEIVWNVIDQTETERAEAVDRDRESAL